MKTLTVNAYDDRHPQHQKLVDLECDTGLDISLLPDFEVTIEREGEAEGGERQPPTATIAGVVQPHRSQGESDAV